jgi:hypothetical protein
MRSFDASIAQMLWPGLRQQDSLLGNKVPGLIDRTTQDSYLEVATGYVPGALRPLLKLGERFVPGLFGGDGLQIGPIPKGTPVGLLTNLNLLAESAGQQSDRDKAILELIKTVAADPQGMGPNATDEKLVDQLLGLSKCPDLVVNRGHYFGTDFLEPAEKSDPQAQAQAVNDRGPGLSDQDKRALIEFIKTF